MTELLASTLHQTIRADHPLELLRKEHELMLELAGQLKQTATTLAQTGPDSADSLEARARALAAELKAGETHYFREENCLFPALERRGIADPPAVMWMEHDQVRETKKRIFGALGEGGPISQAARGELVAAAESLASLLASHFLKEDRILFTMATHVIENSEWAPMLRQFGEIGFWKVVPEGLAEAETGTPEAEGGMVKFGSGSVPVSTLEALLNTLPVEITFVDAGDQVRYFNQNPHRIFHRSTAAIGRQVHRCHPQKSVHLVEQILSEFKAGTRDTADFWIHTGGRFLLIRFFAVRGKDGAYLGCMEVTQDATDIRALDGEKRLL